MPILRPAEYVEISQNLGQFPVTALLGSRQCGKSTLARSMSPDHIFDLENPRDLARLDHAQTVLENLSGLVMIDEIQLRPDLFPLLRYLVDTHTSTKYLLLGSASQELLRQSSESLAGRIALQSIAGFRLHDLGEENLWKHWFRGGYPRAYLASDDMECNTWHENYIATFLERDIPSFGLRVPATTMRRFWTMLAHVHGNILNYSELGRSMQVTDSATRNYVDILEHTFMIRVLRPWSTNTSKRLVKNPKIYLRDSGTLHQLLSIRSMVDLQSHPKLGASWEGYAMEECIKCIGLRSERFSFWATHSGAEVDLLWTEHGKNWGIEFKFGDAPRMTRSMHSALADLELEHLWVVYPGKDAYAIHERVTVIPLHTIAHKWLYP